MLEKRDALAPDYFSPDTQNILDIHIADCPKGSKCVTAGDSDSGWNKLDKNIYLKWGSGNQRWLSYKSSTSTPKTKRADAQVITDIKVLAQNDSSETDGYKYKSNGIWLKFGSSSDQDAITGIDLLFGNDSVEVRPGWTQVDTPLQELGFDSDKNLAGKLPRISFRRGASQKYETSQPGLKINSDGKFKILQVADLHFSTGVGECRDPAPASIAPGCQADPRTIKFIQKVLDIEKPDIVVMTGDQVYGPTAPDSESALYKVVKTFIDRKLPYACIMGNHDDEGSLSRQQSMFMSSNLPYSLGSVGPSSISGYGNYVLDIKDSQNQNSAITFYFLDSHSYAKTETWDYIKEDQLQWATDQASSLKDSQQAFSGKHLSMGFFHIPIPEFRNKTNEESVGHQLEGISGPKYNSGARAALGKIGVKAIAIGHDHINDFCELDTDSTGKAWLCYGGGGGDGGYGGQGFIRRFRTIEFDTNKGEIRTWKRKETDPDTPFDQQLLVSNGDAGSFKF